MELIWYISQKPSLWTAREYDSNEETHLQNKLIHIHHSVVGATKIVLIIKGEIFRHQGRPQVDSARFSFPSIHNSSGEKKKEMFWRAFLTNMLILLIHVTKKLSLTNYNYPKDTYKCIEANEIWQRAQPAD